MRYRENFEMHWFLFVPLTDPRAAHRPSREQGEDAGETRASGFSQLGPRLPLPSSLLDMFQDSEEQHVDDRSQHGGRQRSFQHECGSWATYVYLACECSHTPPRGHLDFSFKVMPDRQFSLSSMVSWVMCRIAYIYTFY